MSTTSIPNLAGAAFALHGPIDIASTLFGKRVCPGDPEGNLLVNRLGPERWVLVKAAAMGVAVLALWSLNQPPVLPGEAALAPFAVPITRGLLGLLVALGALLILPNIGIIAGCLLL